MSFSWHVTLTWVVSNIQNRIGPWGKENYSVMLGILYCSGTGSRFFIWDCVNWQRTGGPAPVFSILRQPFYVSLSELYHALDGRQWSAVTYDCTLVEFQCTSHKISCFYVEISRLLIDVWRIAVPPIQKLRTLRTVKGLIRYGDKRNHKQPRAISVNCYESRGFGQVSDVAATFECHKTPCHVAACKVRCQSSNWHALNVGLPFVYRMSSTFMRPLKSKTLSIP